MNTFPQQYQTTPLQVDVSEEYFERHVVDLVDLGYRLHNFLVLAFKDNQECHEIVNYVYRESFAQMVLSMDFNYDEFCLRLIALPDFEMFKHLQEFRVDFIRDEYIRLFKEIAMDLFKMVYQEVNPMGHRCQFFADSVTISYIVIVKSFEPGFLPISTVI